MKFIILSVLTYMSIGLICCTNKKGAEMKIVHTTQEKDSILLLSGKTQITYKSLRNSLYIGNSAFFFEIQAP